MLGTRLATHREGHQLGYEFHPDWEGRLDAALAHVDKAAIADFARRLASAALVADAGMPENP
ncbi:hypothetical protein GCM10010270_55800 [Streptomyces violaceus]|nr:hypothetical protein GCM10010270_55800 [Streptomyces janthinus]